MSDIEQLIKYLDFGRSRPQSPFLYLQSAGSSGADGSSAGIHLRWELLRNLGEQHLPKGKFSQNRDGFNRGDDYVHLFRSAYKTRFPTRIDLRADSPSAVDHASGTWVYARTNTGTVVYLRFLDLGRYHTQRQQLPPEED